MTTILVGADLTAGKRAAGFVSCMIDGRFYHVPSRWLQGFMFTAGREGFTPEAALRRGLRAWAHQELTAEAVENRDEAALARLSEGY